MSSKPAKGLSLRHVEQRWIAEFSAMASPCEVQLKEVTKKQAEELAAVAVSETRRIEQKFSRYRDDNIIHKINSSAGKAVAVDQETAKLLTYAQECYNLSDGMFDITSGVLRRAWKFAGAEFDPDRDLIESLRELVGWHKVTWDGSSLLMLPEMQIDLGGIGKEYAVDRVAELLHTKHPCPLMVNFGGDIRVMGGGPLDDPWIVGIEDPALENSALGRVELRNGGIATSGDSRRFCLVEGRRMSHILSPLTGWPVEEAPRSVTVIAQHCTEAGILATLAILQGVQAEEFLRLQGVKFHCGR